MKGHYLTEVSDGAIDAFIGRGVTADGGAGLDAGAERRPPGVRRRDRRGRGRRLGLQPPRHRSSSGAAPTKWLDPAEDEERIAAARAYGAAMEPFASGVYVNVAHGRGRGRGATRVQRRQARPPGGAEAPLRPGQRLPPQQQHPTCSSRLGLTGSAVRRARSRRTPSRSTSGSQPLGAPSRRRGTPASRPTPPEQRRATAVHERQADEEQPGHIGHDAAGLPRPAVGTGHREVDPAVIRAEARGPDDVGSLDDPPVVQQRHPVPGTDHSRPRSARRPRLEGPTDGRGRAADRDCGCRAPPCGRSDCRAWRCG